MLRDRLTRDLEAGLTNKSVVEREEFRGTQRPRLMSHTTAAQTPPPFGEQPVALGQEVLE